MPHHRLVKSENGAEERRDKFLDFTKDDLSKDSFGRKIISKAFLVVGLAHAFDPGLLFERHGASLSRYSFRTACPQLSLCAHLLDNARDSRILILVPNCIRA